MHILISGAGVAGPTLAWFLAKSGKHQITIVEKSAAILSHGQNVDIQGAAVTTIRNMGLLDEVRKLNTREKGSKFIDPKGRPFAPFPITEGNSASPTSEFEILRGDLAALLYRATKDLENVEYLFGTTIETVVFNEDESVEVKLSNGKVQAFDLLVAADGQWSKVRKQCFNNDDINSIHQGMYAVYYTVPRQAQDDDWWNIYVALSSRIITLRPDPHGTVRAMFDIMPSTETQANEWKKAARSDRKTQIALLRRDFADAGWEAERLLSVADQAPDLYFHEISQIKMSKWFNKSVVCLGDTAYAPTPLTGMGTSLAIIGAYVLAGEINNLEDSKSVKDALQAYEDKFRPFVEQSQKIPAFLPGIAFPKTAWKRWILHRFLSVVSKLVAIPWVLSKIGGDVDAETRDDGFQLPVYAERVEKCN